MFFDLPIYHLIRWISIVLEHDYTMLYGRPYLNDTIHHIQVSMDLGELSSVSTNIRELVFLSCKLRGIVPIHIKLPG